MKSIATGFCCFALAIIPAAGQAAQISSSALRTPNITVIHPPMMTVHPVSGMKPDDKNTNGNKPKGQPSPYKHIKFVYDANDEAQMDTYVGK